MSEFIVSARKYRPSRFDEVVGQAHVANTLKNALVSDKLAHSFLFCGPRGVGKTTCARILAKVINCENPVDKTQACNECNSCLSFSDNASFNIIELDAASNNSVDNIRNLIDQVRVPPQQGRYKVFIIDEVHMLSTSAFNAFLKTLEEPPSYAIFILATTEKHKILPTILSRCQIFDFKRIQVKDIAYQLSEICAKEGITAEPEALHLIAQKADGAMRDGLSIFDKIASATSGTLSYKDVIANLNILDYEYYFKMIDAFLSEDLSQVFLLIDEIVKNGFEIEQVVQGLSSHMRDLLICKDQRTLPLLEVSDTLKDKYASQAQYATRSMLMTGLDILNQCDVALPRANNKRLHAEIALSKINFSQRAIDAVITSGESEEKKTKVVTSTQQIKADRVEPSTAPQSPTPPPTSTTNTDISRPATPVDATPNPPTTPAVEVKSPQEQEQHQESKVKPQLSSSAINVSLTSILATIDEEDKALDKAKERFGMEGVLEIWEDYAAHNPSPSIQSALRLAKLSLNKEEEILVITVPVAITGNMILEESQLMDRLRSEMGAPTLTFKVDVSPESFPEHEVTVPVSKLKPKEKYELLIKKKPELKKLIDTLEMKPDNDVSL